MALAITTNRHVRPLLDAQDLTLEERADFDYLDWPALERGEDSATFFRYRGELYDLGEFSTDYGITRGAGLSGELSGWDAFASDSFFSGIAVKLATNRYGEDGVIVARVFS